jgi:uncharacterized protein YcbX
MRVDQIWRYPVKSMAGEQLGHAELGREGIPGDRTLYAVDGHGRILTARTHPGLLGLHATLDAEGEVLVDSVPWYDSRPEAAVRAAAGEDAELAPASGSERVDILPLLVATDGSIDDFGHDLRRLRPNIVIEGVDGLAERGWHGVSLQVGDAVVGMRQVRGRCVMTTFDPDTLEQDHGVLRRIVDEFDGRFALDCYVIEPGQIAVGDPFEVLGPWTLADDAARRQLGGMVRPASAPA